MTDCKEHDYQFSDYCGCYVCSTCDDHKGLARCFCGWGLASGESMSHWNPSLEDDYPSDDLLGDDY